MVRRCVVAAVCFMMVGSTVVLSAPAALKMTSGRIAISHDGNAYDEDDIFATAMDFAVMSAFGLQKKLVHLHHSVFQSNNDASFRPHILASAKGWQQFPGFDSSVVFDAYKNMENTAAHFKVQADKSKDGDKLYFCLAGPMHVPYLGIAATAPEKRKYIHCISHSGANESMKSGVSDGRVWSNIKSDFNKFGVITEDIVDQNANLGGKGHGVWSWLDGGMTVKEGIPLSAWKWLWSQDWKGNGDCSDNGMVWYALTGQLNATFADYKERFQNPLPMEGVKVLPWAGRAGFSGDPIAVSFSQNNKVLDVTVNGMNGNSSVGIYDLLSRQICKTPILNGKAQISLNSRSTAGRYIMTVESQGTKVSKQILLK